jgi:cysteine desulfurase/selenocysteine lyase
MSARIERPKMAEGEKRIDWQRIRADFPLLARNVHGKPLVYLDSANTSQKPASVIEAVDRFYRQSNANVSRAVSMPPHIGQA